MQDHYNLLAREEEREMIPLCLDEGIGTIIWSPLARGRLARALGRRHRDRPLDHRRRLRRHALRARPNTTANRAIIDAVGQVAAAHGVSRAQIALAWLRRQPVVVAPLVGAATVQQIDDAIASLTSS